MRNPRFLPITLLVSCTIAVASCTEQIPTFDPGEAPGVPKASVVAAVNEARSVDQVTMDAGPGVAPWELDPSSLITALEQSGGRAFVALKAASSPPIGTTVRMAIPEKNRPPIRQATLSAIPKEDVLAGLAAIEALGAKVVQYYDALGIAEVQVEPQAAASALRADPRVDFVEPIVDDARLMDRPTGFAGRPDAGVAALASEVTPLNTTFVKAPQAWPYTTGTLARLLIIDTGYERGHEDLPNPPLGNCLHGQYGGCDDGQPFPHGTHMTGLIVAQQNGLGLIGVAPGVHPNDIYHWGACDSGSVNCSTSEIVAAVNWAASTLGPRGVVNMSFAKESYSGSLANAAATAYAAGHVLVAGMGNEGINVVRYPAGFSQVVAVGAINPDKTFAAVDFCNPNLPGSNWGSHVDVVGPWAGGLTTDVPNTYTSNCIGTSGATAVVSGVAALIRARNIGWPNSQVIDQLKTTAEDVHTPGWDDRTGFGLVRADFATAFTAPSITATIVAGKPKLSWNAVPFAGQYEIWGNIWPTICPQFELIASTTSTSFTHASRPVSSFIGYNIFPSYTSFIYYVRAIASDGTDSQLSFFAAYVPTQSNPPC